MKTERAQDKGDSRKYFVMLPVLVDDLDLDVYEFRLYVHLKRRAGMSDEVALGLRSIAEHCGMSKPTVIKAKESLQAKGLISVVHQGENEPDLIIIEDIWAENMEAYSNKKKGGQRGLPGVVNGIDQGWSTALTTKYIYIEDPIEDNTSSGEDASGLQANTEGDVTPVIEQEALFPDGASEKPKKPTKEKPVSTEQQKWFDAVCKTVGWDYKVIAKEQIGQVAQTVGILQKAGYTIDDLRAFYKGWFANDWRGKQGQYPTIMQLRSEIGKLKAEAVPTPIPDSPMFRVQVLS